MSPPVAGTWAKELESYSRVDLPLTLCVWCVETPAQVAQGHWAQVAALRSLGAWEPAFSVSGVVRRQGGREPLGAGICSPEPGSLPSVCGSLPSVCLVC